MSFLGELTRRNVVRVGIAYAVIGWVLAQIAEFAFENFGAPDWVLKSFVVLLLLVCPWHFSSPGHLRLPLKVSSARKMSIEVSPLRRTLAANSTS